MNKKVVIIGSGIGGLATASLLAKKGYEVSIYEKNSTLGGRADLLTEKTERGDFVFDKGPSWYMMPDFFEHFFSLVGEKIEDHMELELLSPSYRVFMQSTGKHYDFYADIEKNKKTFDELEKGSGKKLDIFLKHVKKQYEIAKNEFIYKNYDSIFDFINWRVMLLGSRLPLFKKQSTIINKRFKNEVLQKVMQYQTVLLGTSPYETPGIYTLMNYVDFGLGVWYPKGGIYEITKSLVRIAEKNKVLIKTNSPVQKIIVENGFAKGIVLQNGESVYADYVVSNADQAFTDLNLLDDKYRERGEDYWDKRVLAPSAFILYLGIDKKLKNVEHHNLIFSKDWKHNFDQIFKNKQWPNDPSLYVCAPSKSDSGVAPDGTENLFVLVPISAGLLTTDDFKKEYKNKVIDILSKTFDEPDLKNKILVEKIYSVENFIKDYNAYKGTALGLAHTLSQTAIFRPNNISKKVKNLFFVGAGTNPGIGMPICLASAELVYKRIENIKHPFPLKKL